jgi:hypothetical protein
LIPRADYTGYDRIIINREGATLSGTPIVDQAYIRFLKMLTGGIKGDPATITASLADKRNPVLLAIREVQAIE